MHSFAGILENKALWCAVTAWFVAQSLKVITHRFTWHEWSLKRFFGSGGMPSSHTAGMVALATYLGSTQGFDTPYFAISTVFAAVVMYDAAGVRRETGRQGRALNEIIGSVLIEGKPITDDVLKEIVGHSPLEVFLGAVCGIICGIIWLQV